MRKLWINAFAMCLLPALTGCLIHTRKVPKPKMPSVVLSADAQQIVSNINKQYDSIQTLNATVEFQATVGGEKKGQITDYTSIRGYILLRKPEMLRVLGMLPVISTRAFDLASDGNTFKLWIPHENKAIVGRNTVTKPSPKPLENMRPYIFFDSLLIHSVGPDELLSLTSDTKTITDPKRKQLLLQPEYNLNVFKRDSDNSNLLVPVRIIHVDRTDLLPSGEDIYDKDGNIQTQAVYGPYQTFGNFRFPGSITIKRPLEEYQIVITFQKVTVNQSLPDDQFQLKIPEGTHIQNLQ
jgi:outer membrane lipoprotein-sorting protein